MTQLDIQPQQFREIAENLSYLGDGSDSLEYLMELGEALPPLAEEEKTDQNRLRGCVSDAWLVTEPFNKGEEIALRYRGASKSRVTQGRMAVLIALYSGRTAAEIYATDAVSLLNQLGLRENLPLSRAAGLKSMIDRIRNEALALTRV
ncbi:SufE family protein [Devosia sp. CAU 1758]